MKWLCSSFVLGGHGTRVFSQNKGNQLQIRPSFAKQVEWQTDLVIHRFEAVGIGLVQEHEHLHIAVVMGTGMMNGQSPIAILHGDGARIGIVNKLDIFQIHHGGNRRVQGQPSTLVSRSKAIRFAQELEHIVLGLGFCRGAVQGNAAPRVFFLGRLGAAAQNPRENLVFRSITGCHMKWRLAVLHLFLPNVGILFFQILKNVQGLVTFNGTHHGGAPKRRFFQHDIFRHINHVFQHV
mmetsp:Transcript_15073/g.32926  ORF Transcript_15073/g.32926 Transcript_15073/m.32926 type:complete len:237 (+) Transcript_15073:655-1365(+)